MSSLCGSCTCHTPSTLCDAMRPACLPYRRIYLTKPHSRLDLAAIWNSSRCRILKVSRGSVRRTCGLLWQPQWSVCQQRRSDKDTASFYQRMGTVIGQQALQFTPGHVMSLAATTNRDRCCLPNFAGIAVQRSARIDVGI